MQHTFKDLYLISAIEYNKKKQKPLSESVFRRESDMFYAYFNYLREKSGSLSIDDFGKQLIETDLGTIEKYDNMLVPLDLPFLVEDDKDVELNSPKRGGSKKYYVYVKNDKGNIVKVEFGDNSGLSAKINNPEAVDAFVARHNCKNKKDRTTPGYWSCNLPKYAKALGLSGGGNYYW